MGSKSLIRKEGTAPKRRPVLDINRMIDLITKCSMIQKSSESHYGCMVYLLLLSHVHLDTI